MLKVVKRLKERFSGKKGADKINVTIDANMNLLMDKLDKIKNAVENIKADAKPEVSPTLTAYGLSDDKLPEIEGVKIPARPGFSEPFMAYLSGLRTDYQQKQEQSSQRASTPHVRIEFDDINDVPHVWIDGKYISSFPDHGLVRLNLEWNTDEEHTKPKHYYIEYLNGEDTNPYQYTGIGQTNETGE